MADRVMTDQVVAADHRLSQISTASSTNSKRAKAHIGPWQLGRTLGRGSSGRVRLAKHMETGKLAAVKIVPKAHIMDQATTSVPKASESYGIEREVIIMKLIEHPNIMGLYDVWENKGELYLVLEYIEGGELFDYLISRGRLSEREAIHYFRQICYGVDYCHRFNICHRDLKPENLLLDKHRNIKIADFGMAALEANGRLLETSCGSPHYASPEIVSGKTYHGAPSDIWSCGIILFALLSGHLPFDHDNIRQLLLKVQAGKFSMPSSLSVEARDLISKMLVVDPMQRITMRDILRHPLLQKYPPRKVPTENMHHRLPKVDVTQPIERIDREILRNLLILWHHDTKETLIARLREPQPNAEKTFYSLLLGFRQRHGLANRDSSPHHRSVASIRSIRSSKSVRSIASLNSKSGSMRSLKSVRSNRSGRSLISSRRTRRSPVKQPHVTATGSVASAAMISSRASTGAAAHTGTMKSKASGLQASTASSSTPDNANVFAQLLDQVFNSPQLNQASSTIPTIKNEGFNKETRAVSQPMTATSSSLGYDNSSQVQQQLYNSNSISNPQHSPSRNTEDLSMFNAISGTGNSPTAWDSSSVPPQNIIDRKRIMSEPTQPYNLNAVDLPNHTSSIGSSSQPEHNYLLPMIFEEDRFADAIEEEVELKVYKRGGAAQQQKQTRRAAQAPGSSVVTHRGQSAGDNSQLRINNLVSGESFLSYQPSQAAATVAAPVRPAPRAPSGPRAMPDRKPVAVYVEEDENLNVSSKHDAMPSGRVPLAVLNPETLAKASPGPNQITGRPYMEQLQHSQSTQQSPKPHSNENTRNTVLKPHEKPLHVPKRGDSPATPTSAQRVTDTQNPTAKDQNKKSWIRRLTPRLASRKLPEDRRPEKSSPLQPAANKANDQVYHKKPEYVAADKENVLAYTQQKTISSRASSQPDPQVGRRRTSAPEEPRQNWFMKLLASSTQVSSRTLMSTCQPIELRAIILEVLNEWMPHGLALYNDGARGEPIIVSIMRNNSLRLKPARIGIEISPSRSSAATARLVHQKGSKTSFMTFAGEMERRLGDSNVLGVDY